MNPLDQRLSAINNRDYTNEFARIQKKYGEDATKVAIFGEALDYVKLQEGTRLNKLASEGKSGVHLSKMATLAKAEKETDAILLEMNKEAAAITAYKEEVAGYEKVGSLLGTLFEEKGITAEMIQNITSVDQAVKLGMAGGKLLADYIDTLNKDGK